MPVPITKTLTKEEADQIKADIIAQETAKMADAPLLATKMATARWQELEVLGKELNTVIFASMADEARTVEEARELLRKVLG